MSKVPWGTKLPPIENHCPRAVREKATECHNLFIHVIIIAASSYSKLPSQPLSLHLPFMAAYTDLNKQDPR